MLKRSARYCIFAVLVLALPLTAMSREISYDYIQGEYSWIEDKSIPDAEINADGYVIEGSYSVTPNAAVTAGFGIRDYEKFQGQKVDFEELTLGVTAHTPISPVTDLVGNFSLLNLEGEVDDGITTRTDDDTGYTLGVGVLHVISEVVVLNASITREDIFDGTANIIAVGLRLYANNTLSFGAGMQEGSDDVDSVYLNVRLDFQ
ncbi:MAG: outer membrane beta-barrel protein [Gammaproteobacteria bacterium]|jgi:hypothetical protein